jgi:intein/homing endonuclease
MVNFLTKGTRVLTQRGYINIEDVCAKDVLLTHNGNYQNISNSVRKLYTGIIYELHIKHHPFSINCISEQQFYVREYKEIDKTFSNPIWKRIEELSPNDYYGMIINTNNNIQEFNINNVNVKLNKLEYWFIIGYFLGNGWVKQSRGHSSIRFNINNFNEFEIAPKIQMVIPIVLKTLNSKYKMYSVKNDLWGQIFKMFGNETKEKHIPEWVQSIPNDFIVEFLKGFSKTDNCIEKNDILEITTISINLAYELQRLYLKLGLIVNITRTFSTKISNIDNSLVIQKEIFIIRVNTSSPLYNGFIENNYAWFAPLNITKKAVVETPIYNFELQNADSYVVENILVHS